jgi:hypothetical protein
MSDFIRRVFSLLGFLGVAFSAHAAVAEYPGEVARWQEVPLPAATDRGERVIWSSAANYAAVDWRVFVKNEQIHAQLRDTKRLEKGEGPAFTPVAGQFRGASVYFAVDDGWLVGFNKGEFGAALYWFSADGQRSYKISGHQVISFFSQGSGIYAIEGLAHMGLSRGSIVRIDRPSGEAHWQASTVTTLPQAPYAVAVRPDGRMLLTLSGALVSVGKDGKLTTLLADAPWGVLYPNSSVLSADGEKLYVGMRQYVAEVDIPTAKLRFLLPSAEFRNVLPQNDQQRIREKYNR